MKKVGKNNKMRIGIVYSIFAAALIMLTFRLAWIQIIRADEYSDIAINQQTSDIPLEAKRGKILDRNGKELATSATCYNLWARPSQIKDEYTDAEIIKMAKDISKIVNIKEDEVLETITKEQALIKVAAYLEKDTADKVRDLEIYGLEMAEDSKRYYPMGDFASHLLGSVTIDNTGRSGVELEYDQYLSGISGRWIKNTDINGNMLSYGYDKYFKSEDGLNVVMTIDEVIQHYAEKAIERGMKRTKANRITCIVMDPKTADVLAMATAPSFDPNNATEPSTKKERKRFDKLSSKYQVEYLSKMWRNPAVSDTYEPGSTFKLITTSASLEEGTATKTSTLTCKVGYKVAGITLHCWSPVPHGSQTIKQALGNSCNPAMIQLAQGLGEDRFYKYLDLYGLTEKTSIDYPGEVTSQVQAKEAIGPVELATMSYGHGIAITPIQLVTAVSSIGNDGILMEPRVVKELRDNNGKVVKEFDNNKVRRVISSSTASYMKEMMTYVVDKGGGKAAQVKGYNVGGKTGTADKVGASGYTTDTYSSFIGMAPMEDPLITVLVVADSPKGVHYGSVVAAPVAQEIIEDSMRYLEVAPKYTRDEEKEIKASSVTVPNVVGKKSGTAKDTLTSKGLKYKVTPKTSSKKSFKVIDQYPKAGTKVKRGDTIYIYRE